MPAARAGRTRRPPCASRRLCLLRPRDTGARPGLPLSDGRRLPARLGAAARHVPADCPHRDHCPAGGRGMSEPRLYLASASPRRRKLLAEAGIAFEPCLAPVDEEQLSADYAGPLGLLGEHLARHKARAAQQLVREAARHEDSMVLAADTTVLLGGESLAKPVSAEEAAAMLRRLRGREHLVATGVA